MSINSLANFGTPGLNGERSPVLQPIFTNKFRGLFFNFGSNSDAAPYDLTRQLQKMGQPNVSFEKQSLYSYVSTVYVVNRGEWQEITISFLDDITNSVMRRVQNQLAKQQNFYDQTTSRAGENYKFEIDLDVLAGGASAGSSAADPNILRKWCFAGCQILTTNLPEFDTTNQSAMNIEITISYDNATPFDQNGRRMGQYSHSGEIAGQLGVFSTGMGGGGFGISINGNSVNVGVGVGGAGFGVNLGL